MKPPANGAGAAAANGPSNSCEGRHSLSLSLYLSMSCALSLSLSKKHENRWMDRSIPLLWNFVLSVFDFVLFVTSIFVRTRDSPTNCLCTSAVMLRDSQNPDSSLFQLVLYFLSRFRFLGKQTEKTGLFWLFVGVSDEWTGDTCAGGENVKIINPELWQACAGPLVNLPPAGTHVVYFPQGHSEQVGVKMLLLSCAAWALLLILNILYSLLLPELINAYHDFWVHLLCRPLLLIAICCWPSFSMLC